MTTLHTQNTNCATCLVMPGVTTTAARPNQHNRSNTQLLISVQIVLRLIEPVIGPIMSLGRMANLWSHLSCSSMQSLTHSTACPMQHVDHNGTVNQCCWSALVQAGLSMDGKPTTRQTRNAGLINASVSRRLAQHTMCGRGILASVVYSEQCCICSGPVCK